MEVTVELYGDKFGDNNITEAFSNKTFQIRVDIQDEKIKSSFILDAESARLLVSRINAAFKSAEKHGFHVK